MLCARSKFRTLGNFNANLIVFKYFAFENGFLVRNREKSSEISYNKLRNGMTSLMAVDIDRAI